MAKELRTAKELSDMIVSSLGVREIEIKFDLDTDAFISNVHTGCCSDVSNLHAVPQ
jgi:hypothetical protein